MNQKIVQDIRYYLINLISLLTNVPKEALEDEINFEVGTSIAKTAENSGNIELSIDVGKMIVDIILNHNE